MRPALAPQLGLVLLLGTGPALAGEHQHQQQCGGDCRGFPSERNLRACLENAGLSAVWPGDGAAFAATSALAFSLQPANPACVVKPRSAAEVAAAVKCAGDWGYRVSAAGGRHSFQGAALPAGYLVVDTAGLCREVPTVDAASMTMVVGAGCTNAVLNSGLAKSGVARALAVTGTCPSVGIAGYVLGGGVGGATPWAGLAADQVRSVDLVLANGTAVTASVEENEDLYWASRGGGGGLAIVTSLTLHVPLAPANTTFTHLKVKYTPSAAARVARRYQAFLLRDDVDRRLGGDGTLNSGGLEMRLQFLGNRTELTAVLEAAGLLDDGLTGKSEAREFAHSWELQGWIEVSAGGRAGTGGRLTAYQCTYLRRRCDSPEELAAFLDAAADRGDSINVGVDGSHRKQQMVSSLGGLLTRGLDENSWDKIVQIATGHGRSGCNSDFQLNHVLGGAVADVPPNATAFPFRSATWLFGFGYIDAATSAADAAFCHDVANRYTDVLLAAQQADGRPSFLGLYYNYLGVYALRDFGMRYWAENFKRLQRIKSRVDPYNLFSKPLTVHASAT